MSGRSQDSHEHNIDIEASPAGLVNNRDLNLCPGAGSCCGYQLVAKPLKYTQ